VLGKVRKFLFLAVTAFHN